MDTAHVLKSVRNGRGSHVIEVILWIFLIDSNDMTAVGSFFFSIFLFLRFKIQR